MSFFWDRAIISRLFFFENGMFHRERGFFSAKESIITVRERISTAASSLSTTHIDLFHRLGKDKIKVNMSRLTEGSAKKINTTNKFEKTYVLCYE